MSFQTRIVLFFSALFFGVQVLTIVCVYKVSYDNASKQLGQNLVYAEAVFNQLLMERGERIASETRILVADFGFRTTVSEGDAKTIASALENLTLRIRGQRAFYVDLKGQVIADTAGKYQGTGFMFPKPLADAGQQGQSVVFGVLDGELYEWAVVPVLAPIPIGWVAVAIAIDPSHRDRLINLSSLPLEVTLVEKSAGKFQVLASSLPTKLQKLLPTGLATEALANANELEIMELNGIKLITHKQQLPSAASGQDILAVLQIDVAEALAAYWVMFYATLLLLVFGAIVIFLGCVVIAKKITQPLKSLAGASERLMAGQFDRPLPVTSHDELGRMAKTFNRAAQLATQMQDLKQKDQIRREMVATVSHDLRTPLTALHGFLETMQLKSGSLPAHEQQRFLEVALRQSEKVSRLAQELFELAKLECDEDCLHLETSSIAELIQDVLQKFQLSASQKGIGLSVPVLADLPLIAADIGLIERLLVNLIDNALANTPSGGQVSINAWSIQDAIVVSVSDTGIGIPAELLANLFDWESPLSHRARADAGGFGLVIVAKILNLHGGHINVESTLGQGSEFRFQLPLQTTAGLK